MKKQFNNRKWDEFEKEVKKKTVNNNLQFVWVARQLMGLWTLQLDIVDSEGNTRISLPIREIKFESQAQIKKVLDSNILFIHSKNSKKNIN